MTETPEHPTETIGPPPPSTPPSPPPYRSSRLNQVAAWVGIVAGVVFIVAVIFGTGFMVGKQSGGHRFDRHGELSEIHRGGPPMFPMGPRGDFERGPIMIPGPGFQPSEPPTTSSPAPARP